MKQASIILLISSFVSFNTYAADSTDSVPQAHSEATSLTVASSSAIPPMEICPTSAVKNHSGKELLLAFMHCSIAIRERKILPHAFPTTAFDGCTWPTMFDYLELSEFDDQQKSMLAGIYTYAYVAEPTNYTIYRGLDGKLILFRDGQQVPRTDAKM